MLDGMVAFGSERKHRLPKRRACLHRAFRDQPRQFTNHGVAKLVHDLVLGVVVVAATGQPPRLMRPKRRNKLAMDV